MRITFVLPTFPRTPSGGALIVYRYANHLAGRGHDVTVTHLEARPSLVEAGRRLAQNLASGGLSTSVRWTSVHEAITMERCHVASLDLTTADIVIPTFWTTVAPVLERVQTHQSVVHFVQAYETFAGCAPDVHAVYREPCPKIVVSPRLRDQVVALGAHPSEVTVVTNGVDPEVFRPGPPVTSRPLRVAFVAGDVPVKGLDVAIDVITRVRERRTDVGWSAFGPGRRPATLPAAIDYRRAIPQSELASAIYHRAALFLCPSYAEGWGLPALEAMACGTPVVSTRNGGIENFAVDGQTALLREVGDARGLADAVLALLEQTDRRAALATNALLSARVHCARASAERFEVALMNA